MDESKNYKILLSGGGTIGSVSPLLAVVNLLRNNDNRKSGFDFLWLGSTFGPEKKIVIEADINFFSIFSGKFRRYFDWRNFIDPFLIILGFFQSLFFIYRFQPDLIITAGSFISVPVVWAAYIFQIPIIVHQQDIRPGLANKLMSPFASVITVTFEKSLTDYGNKAVWTGNPVSFLKNIPKKEALNILGIDDNLPIVFVTGGGTGSVNINESVFKIIKDLTSFCRVVHLTGIGKGNKEIVFENYYQCDFFNRENMQAAYTVADIVVTRCGLSALTEISNFSKPAILIPIKDSHQEENADVFLRAQAAIVLSEEEIKGNKLFNSIKSLIDNDIIRLKLSQKVSTIMRNDANENYLSTLKKILK